MRAHTLSCCMLRKQEREHQGEREEVHDHARSCKHRIIIIMHTV